MKQVRLDRDSVCAGDDVEPHAEQIKVPSTGTLEQLVQQVANSGYLASIGSGKATWIAKADGKPVAIVAQQWRKPAFLQSGNHALPDLLHFTYRAQEDPGAVLRQHQPERGSPRQRLTGWLTSKVRQGK